jgi:hypothetical protein
MSTPHSLDLRLAPEYRRCAVYAALGITVALGLVVWMKNAGLNQRPWEEIAVGAAVFGGAAAGLLAVAFRYRLRIDARGIWRRRLIRWDLWPWEAFEAGLVRHGKLGDQFTYPAKGWYWRTISASVLSAADRAAFETAVARFRVPPPPPDLPAVVPVKYGLRSRLELSAEGVRLRAHRDDPGELIGWPDVVRAEVFRATHDRPDFSTLNLHLSGRPTPVRLRTSKGTPTWSGADAEVIALFLQRHLNDGRCEVTALRGPPADAAEADRRLVLMDESEQGLRRAGRYLGYMFVGGTLGLGVVMAEVWNRPNPLNWGWADWQVVGLAFVGAAAFLGLQLAMCVGIVYYQRRELRQNRDRVLGWRADGSWTA